MGGSPWKGVALSSILRCTNMKYESPAEVYRQVKEALDKMTPEERRQSLIDAGIITEDNKLTERYRPEEKDMPDQWKTTYSYDNRQWPAIEDLQGKTFNRVYVEKEHYVSGEEALCFELDNARYVFRHQQDCCESVSIEDINGDLSDLAGTPIILAEERVSEGDSAYGSSTWTFYTFRTIKGTVTVRWYGESNGYYSESVELELERKV